MKKLKAKYSLLYNDDRSTADLFNVRTGEIMAQIEFEGEAGVRIYLETGESTRFKVDTSEAKKKTAVIDAAADFVKRMKKKREEAEREEAEADNWT